MAKPIPDGYYSVTPHICVKDSKKALDVYTKAFGAEVLYAMEGPGGKVLHAEMRIGNSIIMMADEAPEMGPGPRARDRGHDHRRPDGLHRELRRALRSGGEGGLQAAHAAAGHVLG